MVAIQALGLGWACWKFREERDSAFEARILRGRILTLTEQAGKIMSAAESLMLWGPKQTQQAGTGLDLRGLMHAVGSAFSGPSGKKVVHDAEAASNGD
jgi:hypothetical protein